MRAIAASFLWLLLSCSSIAGEQPYPLLVSALIPQYPPLAWWARITGDVHVKFQVEADGSVSTVETPDGPPMLRKATEINVRSWKFSTIHSRRSPMKLESTFTYRFAAEGCVISSETQEFTITVKSFHHIDILAAPPYPETTQSQENRDK